MKYLLLILMTLTACGKKTVYTYPPLPMNTANLSTQTEIDEELDLIQNELSELGVKVNLRRIPVVVSELPVGVVGRCQFGKKNDGVYIVLSPSLFYGSSVVSEREAVVYEKEFVKVLIHEIGHCYFNRGHDAPEFVEFPGNVIEIEHEGESESFMRIPKSLMPAEAIPRMPKALKKYYLAELVGKVDTNTDTSFSEYVTYRLVEQQNPEETFLFPWNEG